MQLLESGIVSTDSSFQVVTLLTPLK